MMKKEKTLRMAVTGALLLTVVAAGDLHVPDGYDTEKGKQSTAGTGDAGGRQQRCDEQRC